MHPLLDRDAVDAPAGPYLASVGSVFARFDRTTQDSGNVAYGVRIGAERFFVKTAGAPHDGPGPALGHAERVALLRNAARLWGSGAGARAFGPLTSGGAGPGLTEVPPAMGPTPAGTGRRGCPHPVLPRLLRVIESPHGPWLVYEWVEGELLGVPRARREDPDSAFARFRRLPAATVAGCLDAIIDLHVRLAAGGWVSVDFYDGCLIYDFATGRLWVVDLDMYHPGPFVNGMGRMFGSRRFMAPEEFERGARIDERTTVFRMGRTALVLLSGGSLDPGAFRGSGVRFAAVARACDPDPARRFAAVAAFQEAWRGG